MNAHHGHTPAPASEPHCDHCTPAPTAAPAAHAHAGHANGGGSLPRLTTSATIHCLTGCAIGELAGLVIGVRMGLAPMETMILATVLAYASGFGLSLRPLLASGMTLGAAFAAIWLGEAISIGVMEIAMNATDYFIGGVTAPSIVSPLFWGGYAAALVAGFAAAWPVNYWMLSRSIKKPCH